MISTHRPVHLFLLDCLTNAGLVAFGLPMMVVRQGDVPDPGRNFLVQETGENLWHVFMTETQIDANNIVPVIVK